MFEGYIKTAHSSETAKHRRMWDINTHTFNGQDILFTLYILEFTDHEEGEK